MDHPKQDIADRTPVWGSMQDLFMDTDVSLSYDFIAERCAESKYSLQELEDILFNEVLPAMKFNMLDISAPEWAGFKTDWVVQRVLEKHRYGKRKPWMFYRYTNSHWKIILPKIERIREKCQ